MLGKQVHALLEGHELQQFIDRFDDGVPSPTTQLDGVTAPNQAYVPMERARQIVV